MYNIVIFDSCIYLENLIFLKLLGHKEPELESDVWPFVVEMDFLPVDEKKPLPCWDLHFGSCTDPNIFFIFCY